MTERTRSADTTRIAELETILTWEGQIDNARIREIFGVQNVWASRLLTELVERLGPRAKRPQKHGPLHLVRSSLAQRMSPEPYLDLLEAAPGGLESDPLLFDTRMDLTSVSPDVFATVRQAARSGVGVRINYRSMSHPEGSERLVFPHAIVRAPRRWHMRAWCSTREDFRDFVLARVQSAELVQTPTTHARVQDRAWNELTNLVLAPHPALTAEQQGLIAAEYFPGARARRLQVRECLVGYVLQDLRVAVDAARQVPPEYQLLLANPSDARIFGASE